MECQWSLLTTWHIDYPSLGHLSSWWGNLSLLCSHSHLQPVLWGPQGSHFPMLTCRYSQQLPFRSLARNEKRNMIYISLLIRSDLIFLARIHWPFRDCVGTGMSFKFKLIDKLTPRYKRSCWDWLFDQVRCSKVEQGSSYDSWNVVKDPYFYISSDSFVLCGGYIT